MQDIVCRSPTLDHVTAVSAFTCSRMRPDGFGGMAVVITADFVRGKSTNDILEDFLSSDAAPATARMSFFVFAKRRSASIAAAIESDPDLTTLAIYTMTAEHHSRRLPRGRRPYRPRRGAWRGGIPRGDSRDPHRRTATERSDMRLAADLATSLVGVTPHDSRRRPRELLARHGDLLLRLANATREERKLWWRGVKAAARLEREAGRKGTVRPGSRESIRRIVPTLLSWIPAS